MLPGNSTVTSMTRNLAVANRSCVSSAHKVGLTIVNFQGGGSFTQGRKRMVMAAVA